MKNLVNIILLFIPILICSTLSTLAESEEDKIFFEIMDNNIENVKKLSQNNYLINSKGKNLIFREGTPLHIAAKYNYTEIAKILIKLGANLSIKDMDSNYPIHIAAKYGSLETLILFLESGINVDMKNGYLDTSLEIATENGKTEVVNYLMKNILLTNKQKRKLFFQSCKGGIGVFKIFKMPSLIHSQTDKNDRKMSCLMYSSMNGHLEIVMDLVENKVNINEKNLNGWTALMYAADNNHLPIVEYLVNHDADIFIKDKNKLSAIEIGNKNKLIKEFFRIKLKKRSK